MAKKAADAFRTISEVSDWLGVSPHVLRFWESKFTQVKPVKRAGGRRYYRPADMELLGGIRKLLHEDGLSVKAVQKVLKEQGVRTVSAMSPSVTDAPGGTDAASGRSETAGQKDAASLPLFSAELTPLPVEPADSDDKDLPLRDKVADAGISDPGIAEARAPEPPEPDKPTVESAAITNPGIAEPGASAHRSETATDNAPSGPIIAPLPDLPSETPQKAEVPTTPTPEPEPAPTAPSPAPVIAPLPETNLTVTERLQRVQPGQIPKADLAPLYARLQALRTRMDSR